ncbi:hypothetical protein AAG747_24450 [Rapidithrix thailandica]|uniref:Uncharacterized protein n=1 Tax=Rapidithrix thailandica TaxID=413964 RepID=A0AAW9S7C3_9BACT
MNKRFIRAGKLKKALFPGLYHALPEAQVGQQLAFTGNCSHLKNGYSNHI